MSLGIGTKIRVRRRRRTIMAAIDATDAIRLNVGSGGTTFPGWISSDRKELDITKSKDWERLLRGRPVDNMLAEHVLEHLENPQIIAAFENIARFLKVGGVFRMAVPDGNHPSAFYRARTKPGGTGAGADDHRVFLTIRDVARLERCSGMKPEPIEYFDDDGRFVARPMLPERGFVARCTANFPEHFTGPQSEIEQIVDSVPSHLREQFEGTGLSYTSLLIDWVKV